MEREKARDTCGYDDNSFLLGRGQTLMEMEETKKQGTSKGVVRVEGNKNSS